MKEIIQWHENFYPALGGGPAHIDNLISHLNTTFKFKLITNYVKGAPHHNVYKENVVVCRFPQNPFVPQSWLGKKYGLFPFRVINDLQILHSKLRYLKKTQFDLLHIHGVVLYRNLLQLSIKLRRNIYKKIFNFSSVNRPKVLTLHNFFPGFTDDKIITEIYNHHIDSFDNIICVDQQIYEYCLEYCREKQSQKAVWFISNSVDTKKFFYAPPQRGSKFIIGFAGRIANTVDVGMMNSLISQLPQGMEFCLAATGDVHLIRIPPEVKDRVKVVRNVPPQDMPGFYHQIDILFNPVLHEGLTRVTLEAMACGRPVIMYRMKNSRPYIDEKNSFIINKDLSALMTLLSSIAKNPDQLMEMGKNATQVVNEKMSNEVVLPRIKKIYDNLLERNAG